MFIFLNFPYFWDGYFLKNRRFCIRKTVIRCFKKWFHTYPNLHELIQKTILKISSLICPFLRHKNAGTWGQRNDL